MIKTKPEEFVKFHKALMSNAPEGYIPWYFPVKKSNKAPDAQAIAKRSPVEASENPSSWIAQWARLSFEEAYKRLVSGYNVGIAGRKYDDLIIIDIDHPKYIKYTPKSLTIISRKRNGRHAFCWKHPSCKVLPCNIPTEYGEMRSSDQYVVASGSYVTTKTEDETLLSDENLGVYTVENEMSPIQITYDEIPEFFKVQKKKINTDKKPQMLKYHAKKTKGTGTALFNITITDIVPTRPGVRDPHPLHDSDTGSNFSTNGELATCWRHLVSLNAYQFLVVKSGYMTCLQAGTGHKNSGAGESEAKRDYGALFYAWRQAKIDGLLPKEDRIPLNALKYIAFKHKIIERKDIYRKLTVEQFNKVIKIIKEEY